jgi:hypothetical protein
MKEYGVVGDIDSIVSKRDQCLEGESILLIQVYTAFKQTQDFQGRFVNKWKKVINEKYQSLIQNEILSVSNLLLTKGTHVGCKCLCTR